jgi:hypothetical protein
MIFIINITRDEKKKYVNVQIEGKKLKMLCLKFEGQWRVQDLF